MRTVEFLNIKGLPQSWRATKESELGKAVFSVIEDESPVNIPDSCPEKDTNVRYGFALGYAHCQNKFKELAFFPQTNHDPTKRKSTYGTKKKQNNAT